MDGVLGTLPRVTREVCAPEEKVSLLRLEPRELHLRGDSRALQAVAARGRERQTMPAGFRLQTRASPGRGQAGKAPGLVLTHVLW